MVQALVRRAQDGVYGYAAPTPDFYLSLVNWMNRRHGWAVQPEWVCLTPGVELALNMLVRTFVEPGAQVLIQPPV